MMASILDILKKWPSRSAVYHDAKAARPELEMIAVHRWHQRCSVPSEYFMALAEGAARRKIDVTVADLVSARRGHADQAGQAGGELQVSASKTKRSPQLTTPKGKENLTSEAGA